MAPLVSQNAFINVPLTNVSVGFAIDQTRFVADRVFPQVPVALQGGMYYKWDNDDWLRDNMKKRADGTESQGVDLSVTEDTYFTSVWALHRQIGDQLRANAPAVFALDSQATQFLTTQYLIRKEVSFFDSYFQKGVWGTEYTGVGTGTPTSTQFLQWDNDASTPLQDVQRMKTEILLKTGYLPNKLVVPLAVDQALKNHPDIMARVVYGGNNATPAQITNAALAALFEVEEYLVSTGVMNGANAGAAPDRQFFLSNSVLLAYAPPAAGIFTPSAGYTLLWTGYIGTGGLQISKFRMEHLKSDRIEGETAFDQKVVAPSLGGYFANVIG